MLSSTENLYPVVHDLTDMEYGNNSSGMCCCDEVLGGFTVKDLAIPILTPRSLPVTPPSSPPAFESHKHANASIDASQSRLSTTKGTMPSTNSETRSRRGRSIPTLPRSSSNSGRFGKRSFEHYRSSSNHSTMASSTSLTEETTSSTDDTYGFENFNRDEVMTDANAFDSIFVLTRQVFRCKVSTIWECVHRERGTRHCVKITDKRRFTCRADEEMASNEIRMLLSLQDLLPRQSPSKQRHPQQSPSQNNHSPVPRLVHVSQDVHHYYVVMEYVEGGNLLSYLQSRPSNNHDEHTGDFRSGNSACYLEEDHVRSLARSLLLGLQQLHDASIGHFNIQLENILLAGNQKDIVLCDFGCSRKFEPEFPLSPLQEAMKYGIPHEEDFAQPSPSTKRYGNMHYAAPELLQPKQFTTFHNTTDALLAADMWSVGIVMYYLLCGHLPFESVPSSSFPTKPTLTSKRTLRERIESGKFQFHGAAWHTVSRSAKQFISALLHLDPSVRMTVKEALGHPWMITTNPPMPAPRSTRKETGTTIATAPCSTAKNKQSKRNGTSRGHRHRRRSVPQRRGQASRGSTFVQRIWERWSPNSSPSDTTKRPKAPSSQLLSATMPSFSSTTTSSDNNGPLEDAAKIALLQQQSGGSRRRGSM